MVERELLQAASSTSGEPANAPSEHVHGVRNAAEADRGRAKAAARANTVSALADALWGRKQLPVAASRSSQQDRITEVIFDKLLPDIAHFELNLAIVRNVGYKRVVFAFILR